eukprot:2950768-Amphidinium_carterae.1
MLLAMVALATGPGGRNSSALQDKTRQDCRHKLVQWNSTGFNNFGYRTTCFQCKQDRGNAKLNKTGKRARTRTY